MSDLLHRLRSSDTRDAGRPWSDMHEAADEIERLRADIDSLTTAANAEATEVERLRGLLQNSEMTVGEVISDNERLRAELTVRLDYIRQIDADNRELRLTVIKLAEGK